MWDVTQLFKKTSLKLQLTVVTSSKILRSLVDWSVGQTEISHGLSGNYLHTFMAPRG